MSWTDLPPALLTDRVVTFAHATERAPWHAGVWGRLCRLYPWGQFWREVGSSQDDMAASDQQITTFMHSNFP